MSRNNRRSERRTFQGRTLDASLDADPRDYKLTLAPDSASGLQSRKWDCPVRLDQGREGACVGFGGAHHIACHPWPQMATRRLAMLFYRGAQDNDEWAGNTYSGTSGSGLMRFLSAAGLICTYYRVRTFDELCYTISTKSAVSGGFPWRAGCFEPDRSGFIRYEGEVKGGHYVCINGVDFESEFFTIVQSWGRKHGIGGEVKVRFSDMRQMIQEGARIYWFEEKSIDKLLTLNKSQRRRWWNPFTWLR